MVTNLDYMLYARFLKAKADGDTELAKEMNELMAIAGNYTPNDDVDRLFDKIHKKWQRKYGHLFYGDEHNHVASRE